MGDKLFARSKPSRRRRLPAAVAAIAALAVTWALVSIRARDIPRGDALVPGRPILQDRPAPAFTRPLLRGDGDIALAAYRGSIVVVNFWQSFCRPCRSEAPSLASLSREYRARGVSFLGVDYEDRPGPALAAARSFALPYPSVGDPAGSVGDAFGVVGLPTTYIIGADQRVRYMIIGRIDPARFRTALDSVMTGSEATS